MYHMIYDVLDETQNERKTIGGANNYKKKLWKEPIFPCPNLQLILSLSDRIKESPRKLADKEAMWCMELNTKHHIK